MSDQNNCPACKMGNVYFDGTLNICPDCFHEWSNDDVAEATDSQKVKDSNGAELFDGDEITVIKDLKVKGSSMVVKRGTKVKNIKLSSDDPTHIEGKVDGSSIFLKTEFIRKG